MTFLVILNCIDIVPLTIRAKKKEEFIVNQNHPIPAVRAVIEDKEGKVLLLRRDNTDSSEGEWCLPGGKIDLGQTAEEAMIREVKEETDLLCEEVDFLFYQDNPPTPQLPEHFITLYFRCRIRGRLQLNDESSDFVWISPQELKQYRITFRNDLALVRYWSEQKD